MGSRCLKSAQPDMSLSKNPSIHYLPLIQFRVDGGDHSSLKNILWTKGNICFSENLV